MDKRAYGRTGDMLSVVGLGGIVVKGMEAGEASRIVGKAVDRGVNYFDVAPGYGDAEERLGPALEPYRNDVFLACKTGMRDRAGAEAELHRSLKRLRTDHFDLYQLHGMTTEEDLEQVTAPGGALETFIRAREEGLVRHLGFSAHSAEVAMALMDDFEFDSVLFPVNWVLYFTAGFGPQVVEKAVGKGMAVLALKGMAMQLLPEGIERPYANCWYEPSSNPQLASLALRFTLSQPITAAIPPGDPGLFELALDLAEDFTPITDAELDELKALARGKRPIFELAGGV